MMSKLKTIKKKNMEAKKLTLKKTWHYGRRNSDIRNVMVRNDSPISDKTND